LQRRPAADVLRQAALSVLTFFVFAASGQIAALVGAAGSPPSEIPHRAAAAGRGLLPGTRGSSTVDLTGTRTGVSGRSLVLAIGMPLTVVDGDTSVSLRAPRGASVSDALDLAGVRLGPLDRVVARDDGAIASGDVIRVLRVTESTALVPEPIAFSVTTVADPSLTVGRSFVVTPGVLGLALNSYRVVSVDGVETERVLTAAVEVQAPVGEVRHIGTRQPPVPSEIEAIIRAAADAWGADADQLLRVAWCESRYNPSAYNASSGTSGLFQFKPLTWAANSVRAGYGGVSVFDPVANANTAAYMFANHQAGQWACK
jgi:hypothetical protein